MPNRANTNVNRSKQKAQKAKRSKAKEKRGRKSWATGEQLETLKKHLAVYRNEVCSKLKQNSVTKFYDNVTADFLDKYRWDIPRVTDCDIENIGGRGHPPNTSGPSRSVGVSSTSNTAGPLVSDSTSSPDASMPTNASNSNALTPGNGISFSFTNSKTGGVLWPVILSHRQLILFPSLLVQVPTPPGMSFLVKGRVVTRGMLELRMVSGG